MWIVIDFQKKDYDLEIIVFTLRSATLDTYLTIYIITPEIVAISILPSYHSTYLSIHAFSLRLIPSLALVRGNDFCSRRG